VFLGFDFLSFLVWLLFNFLLRRIATLHKRAIGVVHTISYFSFVSFFFLFLFMFEWTMKWWYDAWIGLFSLSLLILSGKTHYHFSSLAMRAFG